jgi:6-pyruvoyltetrahydropterin/6-carboxytetrahydropterin synthase
MPVSLTRVVRFQAEHHLWMAEWTPQRNRATFGPLTQPHAHDYSCAVTVSGPVDPHSGMVVDLGLLDQILTDEVLLPLDGKHLNRDIPAFGSGHQIPTCEALALWLFLRISARLPAGVGLERVRVEEDPTLYGDCTGID